MRGACCSPAPPDLAVLANLQHRRKDHLSTPSPGFRTRLIEMNGPLEGDFRSFGHGL